MIGLQIMVATTAFLVIRFKLPPPFGAIVLPALIGESGASEKILLSRKRTLLLLVCWSPK